MGRRRAYPEVEESSRYCRDGMHWVCGGAYRDRGRATSLKPLCQCLCHEVPERCQAQNCGSLVETWCPLCEQFFCKTHDVLPSGHVCLRE